MSDVSIAMTADNKDVLKAFAQTQQKLADTEQKLKLVGKSAAEIEAAAVKSAAALGKNATAVAKLERELAEARAEAERLNAASSDPDGAATAKRQSEAVAKLEKNLAEAVREQHKLRAETEVYDRALTAAARKQKGVTDSRGWASARTGLQGMGQELLQLAGFAGIAATAVAAVTEGIEKTRAREKAAGLAQLGAGAAIREARKAFGADDSVGSEGLEPEIERIAQTRGSDIATVAATAQSALSAKGQLSNRAALDAVETAIRLAPKDAGEASTVAGRLLDTMKATGTQDPRAAAGFLQNLQANARVTSMGQVGSNLVPAINSLVSTGDEPAQAAAIVATLNQLLSDAEGSTTKTAAINLGTRLKDFIPSDKGKDGRGKFAVPESQRSAFEGAGTTSERIGVIQQSPELRRAFLGQASFDAESKNFIEALLSNQEAAANAYAQARKNITPLNADMAAVFEQQIAFIDAGKYQAAVDVANRGGANIEALNVGDSRRAAMGTSRGVLEESIANVNLPGLDWYTARTMLSQFNNLTGLDASVNPAEVAQRKLFAYAQPGTLAEDERAFLLKQIQALEPTRQQYEATLTPEILARRNSLAYQNSQTLGELSGKLPAVPQSVRDTGRLEDLMERQNKLLERVAVSNEKMVSQPSQTVATPAPPRPVAPMPNNRPPGPRPASALSRR